MRRIRHTLALLLSYVTLLVLALLFASPIVLMVVGSLKPEARVLVEAGGIHAFLPGEWDLRNYRDVFARVDFIRYLLNSAFITGMVVLAGLLVNSMAGYAFARLEWRGRKVLFTLVLAILILPLEAIAVPLFYQVTLFGWRDTYLVQIVPFLANAFSIYLFYTFFLGLQRELEEAERIDGAGVLRTFTTIIIPNFKPVFATVAILTFLIQWGVFLWPLMVTSGEAVRPLPLAIATFYTLPPLQWGDIFAFGVMMVLPILLVFLLFQRWFIRGVVSTGIKG
jgi:multiple sugar transport system permease protein